MAVPRTINKEFKLGDHQFRHYRAQDSHGSVCNTYYVDGLLVCPEEFYRILKEEVQDGKDYIAHALGLVSVR